MGWFDDDDDDDDDDEGRRKRPELLSDFGTTNHNESNNGDTETGGVPSPSEALRVSSEKNNDDDGEDEDDPLEAYMKSLESSQHSSSSSNLASAAVTTSSRLDMENEDEATDHWTSSAALEEEDDDDNITPSSSSNKEERCNGLNSFFHKASDTDDIRQEHRRVDIVLNKVEHDSMKYSPFTKRLMLSTTSTSTGHEWRHQHFISCHPPVDPIYEFAELRDILPSQILEWIANQDAMTKPTLVQAQLIPVALSGQDVIATASTGSGKTLSYLLPLIAHLVTNNGQKKDGTTTTKKHSSRALILVPTRELALQVEKVAKSMLQKISFLKALAITGGNMGRYQLSQALLQHKPQLVVATPGRLLDVLSTQQKSKHEWLLQEITFLVLDEADKMLQLGFASQVTQILDSLRPDRQSILTSATWHGRLERYCQQWVHQPTRISVGRSGSSSEHVEQHVMVLPSTQAKEAFLKEMLPTFCDVGRTIVFCARRDECERLAQVLVESGFTQFQTLHGDKHPSDRQAALKAFTKGIFKVLVATDVAGRGLDIPQVATVINYDPAKNWDTHVHRIGRAGRLNEKGGQQRGSAYTLLTPNNSEFAQTLVQAYRRENREISSNIEQLALRSRQTPKESTKASYRRGLGFTPDGRNTDTSSYYQPSPKRSRWS